jgi:hypothetical protein
MWELIPALTAVQCVAVTVSAILSSVWIVVKIRRTRKQDRE